jgi:hypothetical protein
MYKGKAESISEFGDEFCSLSGSVPKPCTSRNVAESYDRINITNVDNQNIYWQATTSNQVD